MINKIKNYKKSISFIVVFAITFLNMSSIKIVNANEIINREKNKQIEDSVNDEYLKDEIIKEIPDFLGDLVIEGVEDLIISDSDLLESYSQDLINIETSEHSRQKRSLPRLISFIIQKVGKEKIKKKIMNEIGDQIENILKQAKKQAKKVDIKGPGGGERVFSISVNKKEVFRLDMKILKKPKKGEVMWIHYHKLPDMNDHHTIAEIPFKDLKFWD